MTYISCSICNRLDFDARFDLHFKGHYCCEYIQNEESVPVLSTQSIFAAGKLVILAKDYSRVWTKSLGQ